MAVTGGYGALGRVVAAVAADRGASVCALDFAPAPPDGLAERLGIQCAVAGRRRPLFWRAGAGRHRKRRSEVRSPRRAHQYRRRVHLGKRGRRRRHELGSSIRDQSKDCLARVAGGDPSSVGERRRPHRQCRRHFGGESRRGNGTLRGQQRGRASADGKYGRRTEEQRRHRQRGAAFDHRHSRQPRRYARRRVRSLGARRPISRP